MDKIVYTYGVWDLLHVNHVALLREAAELGDMLIVGVMTDEAAAEFKRWPIIPFEERVKMVLALDCVDMVQRQNSRNPVDVLRTQRIDVLAHGDDWDEIPGAIWVESHGGEVVKLPYHKGQSTSKIIQDVQARWMMEHQMG